MFHPRYGISYLQWSYTSSEVIIGETKNRHDMHKLLRDREKRTVRLSESSLEKCADEGIMASTFRTEQSAYVKARDMNSPDLPMSFR